MTFAIAAGAGLAVAQDSKADASQQLLNAVFKGDLASVRILLDNGANTEAQDANGLTPLIMAAENNDIAIVKLLLAKGANVSTKDRRGETAMIAAARCGNSEIVTLLLEKTSSAREKKRALFAAIHGSGIVIPEASDNANNIPANQTNHPRPELPHMPWVRTVSLLVKKGVPIEARDEDGSTTLISAATYAATDIVTFLLKKGADTQATDKYGNTALIAAACECALATMNSTYDIAKMLLNEGVDPNVRNHEGTTALMNAASGFGDAAIVKLLIESGADPTAKDKHGNTALALAIKRQRPDKVRLLKRAMAQTH